MSKFTIKESVSGTAKDVPVKLSAVLKEGEFFTLGVMLNGVLTPCQYNVLTKYDDGSIRHALIVFFMNTTGQIGTIHNVILDPVKQSLAKGVAIPKNFDLALLACKVQMVDSQDFAWSKEVPADSTWPILRSSLLQPDPGDMLHGPLANEIEFISTLDGILGSHPSLKLIVRYRFFKDWPSARLEIVFENSNYSSLKDINMKSIDIWISDQLAFSLPARIFGPGQRFRVVRWMGTKPPIDDFNIKQDRVYLREMNVVPLYDLNNPLSSKDVDVVIGNYFKKNLLEPVGHPDGLELVPGILYPAQSTTGDRADIDPQPDWATCTWNSDDLRGYQVQFAADGNGAGAFPIHMRDPNTNEMGLKNNYHITFTGDQWKNPAQPNRAHHPLVGLISYAITGDKYYAEELAAWASYCAREWPWDRTIKYPGSRDDAWSTRTIGWGAFILPDKWGLKTYFKEVLDQNLDLWIATSMNSVTHPLHSWEAELWNGSGSAMWPCAEYISPWQYAWKIWSLFLIWKLFNDERAKTLFEWAGEYVRMGYVTRLGDTFTSKDGQLIKWDPKYLTDYHLAAKKYTPMLNSKGAWSVTPGSEVPITNFAEALWYVHVNESNGFTGKPYPSFPAGGPEPENWVPNPPSYRRTASNFEAYAMEDLAPTMVLAGFPDADKIWAFVEPFVDTVLTTLKRPKGTKRIPTLS